VPADACGPSPGSLVLALLQCGSCRLRQGRSIETEKHRFVCGLQQRDSHQAAEAGFEIDMVHFPNCGGHLKIIAAIMEQPVIEKIVTHLGLQPRAPPSAPAPRSQLQAA